VGDVIEVAFRVGEGVVGGGGDDAVAHGEDAGDEFDGSGGGDEVAHHGFDGADGDVFGVVAEDAFDGVGFGGVVFLGAGAGCVDVMDVARGHFGVAKGFPDGDHGSAAVGVLVGDAVGVGGGTVAGDFGEDSGLPSAFLNVFEGFENDDACAFAEDE